MTRKPQLLAGGAQDTLEKDKKTCMTMQDAFDFMISGEAGLNLTVQNALHCFGMSKQTVIKENSGTDAAASITNTYKGPNWEANGNKVYFELTYVEFLEMFARIADLRFSPKAGETIPGRPKASLKGKAELLMDEVFP